MQITPGQTTLSLAMLKALGSQASAPAATAAPVPAQASLGAEARLSTPGASGASASHLPRGSFVDLRA